MGGLSRRETAYLTRGVHRNRWRRVMKKSARREEGCLQPWQEGRWPEPRCLDQRRWHITTFHIMTQVVFCPVGTAKKMSMAWTP
jgi:hypothetical protein